MTDPPDNGRPAIRRVVVLSDTSAAGRATLEAALDGG